jgi:hypothetical protein
MRSVQRAMTAVFLLLAAGAGAVTPSKPAPTASKLRITGVLTRNDGKPFAGQRVFAFPLDPGGTPFLINVLGKGGTVELWNPSAKTDARGHFVLDVPLIVKVGSDTVSEVAVGPEEPPGGLVTVTVLELQFADGKKEHGFVRTERVPLLRHGSETVRVKVEKGNRDIGTVAVD